MKIRRGCGTTAALFALTLPIVAGAAEHVTPPSPEGLWATIDDRSGAERSLVRVHLADGHLTGTIERVQRRADESPDPVCAKCRGDRKGAHILGMVILWGHRADDSRWIGGTILDPENGREYSSTLWLTDTDTLRVRGHWGPFHRTQTWYRRRAAANVAGGGGAR